LQTSYETEDPGCLASSTMDRIFLLTIQISVFSSFYNVEVYGLTDYEA
jgi:hypothetical protein